MIFVVLIHFQVHFVVQIIVLFTIKRLYFMPTKKHKKCILIANKIHALSTATFLSNILKKIIRLLTCTSKPSMKYITSISDKRGCAYILCATSFCLKMNYPEFPDSSLGWNYLFSLKNFWRSLVCLSDMFEMV